MECTIERVDAEALPLYATIPISFTVSSAFRVEAVDGGLGGFALIEEPVTEPYVKWTHHDQGDDPDPLLWPREFDVSHWGFFLALAAGRPAGGSVVAVDTPAVHMLENRPDLAVLWDIRVRPDLRRHGLGTRLFQAARNSPGRAVAPSSRSRHRTSTCLPAASTPARDVSWVQSIATSTPPSLPSRTKRHYSGT